MTAVRIIAVTFNSAACLPDMVRSVMGPRTTPGMLVVVDNASGDSTRAVADGFAAADPRIQVLANPDNFGFGRACNQGADGATEPLLLFLNPDCVLAGHALDALVQTLESNPGIGLLGARILDPDGGEQRAIRRRDPTPARVLAGMPLIGRLFGNETIEIAHDFDPRAADVMPVDAVSGALMLVRRDVFESIGGFDEGYFLHCEDLDLCRRVRAAGHAVAIDERVTALHLKGASSRSRPVRVEWHKLRGMQRYFLKFDASSTAWPLRWALRVGLYLRFLVRLPWLLLARWRQGG